MSRLAQRGALNAFVTRLYHERHRAGEGAVVVVERA